MIRNSMKQMLRMPVKSFSFLLLIAASGMFLTLGAVLLITNNTLIRSYEDTFITIGTVEQKPLSISQSMRWDAERKDYVIRQKPEYSKFIPSSQLSFNGANYIQEPEKRSYYGSYSPEYTLVSEKNNADMAVVIAEISPLEDCIPDESVKVRLNKVLLGSLSEGTSIWFCNHYTKNPKPLQKDKKYAVVLYLQSWAHGEHYEALVGEEERTLEYVPVQIAAEQYESDGTLMNDSLEKEGAEDSPYYEVTEGFYNTDIGTRLLNLAKGYRLFNNTQPVTGTNATILLMPFYNGDAYISLGRDILQKEYEEGKRVCLVSRKFAENNSLIIGNTVRLQLYYTNSKNSAGQFFLLDGSGGEQGMPVDKNGDVLSVFENSEYTIVGIYDISPGASQGGNYSMGGDEVIVPMNSIQNRDMCNIKAYGPMKGYTTSFQIPNGSVEEYLAAWEQFGTDELEINFYDMGYSQIKSGLENMKNMSLVLLVVGFLMVIFLLLFYSHLFITNQKERTAIERCLGVEKKRCRKSLLLGMLVLLMIGSILGCGLGGLLSKQISAQNLNQVYYDASYSSVADVEMKDASQVVSENTGVIFVTSLISIIFVVLLGAIISINKINRNLKLEPMKLLSEKRNE